MGCSQPGEDQEMEGRERDEGWCEGGCVHAAVARRAGEHRTLQTLPQEAEAGRLCEAAGTAQASSKPAALNSKAMPKI